MLIISNCRMTILVPINITHLYLWEKGAMVHCNWFVKQLHMMVVHHGNCNAINRLNKEAFGLVSICEAIGKKN